MQPTGELGAGVWLLLGLATIVSCVVAHLAGRCRASYWWGLLGPVGWIIAAVHGVGGQVSEAVAEQPRPPAPLNSDPGVKCSTCELMIPRGRTVCPHCGEAQ